MRQLKLFYRFFLVAIWLGMVNPSSLQAQEVYFFEDFETGGDLHQPDDGFKLPEGWTAHILSNSGMFSERFRIQERVKAYSLPAYPFSKKFALYNSFLAGFNGRPDSASLESPGFPLPPNGTPIVVSFDHQFEYGNDQGNGWVEIWNGTTWIPIYEVGSKNIGFVHNSPSNRIVTEHIPVTEWLSGLDSSRIRFLFDHESSGSQRGSWWSIDNVQIFTPPSVDIITTTVEHGSLPFHCYGENEELSITLRNDGTNRVNFEEDTLLLTIETLGVENHTYPHLITTGTLEVNESQTIVVDGIDLSTAGNYWIQTYPSMKVDANFRNDTSRLYRSTLALHTPPLPTLDFDNLDWETATAMGWYTDNDGVITNFLDFEGPNNGYSFGTIVGLNRSHPFLKTPRILLSNPIELSFELSLQDMIDNPSGMNIHTLGTDNILSIQISTDCGQSFEVIHQIEGNHEISDQGQIERFRISGYEGQEVILAIRLEERGEEQGALYWSLDNLNIRPVLARDIGISVHEDFIEGVYTLGTSVQEDWWVCGDFNHPVQIKLINHGAMLQNNFEVVGTISEGWNDDFSILINEPLYPEEERILTLGTTNTYNAGQYDLEAYIKLPNDDDHSNDTLHAFLLALPPEPSAQFYHENQGNGKIQFQKAISPGNPQYEWNFGDGKGTSNLRNPSYTYEENGTYTVTLIVTDDCGSNSHTETVVVDTVVSIDDFDLEQTLSITPNPSNGSFTVQIEGKYSLKPIFRYLLPMDN